jgi:gamma-glutamyltranspeptidase / glutathione hydrolase
MYSSFGKHEKKPGALTLNDAMPDWTRAELKGKGYTLDYQPRTSGPINAIYLDWKHGTFWGGSSNHGEDYGIGW